MSLRNRSRSGQGLGLVQVEPVQVEDPDAALDDRGDVLVAALQILLEAPPEQLGLSSDQGPPDPRSLGAAPASRPGPHPPSRPARPSRSPPPRSTWSGLIS